MVRLLHRKIGQSRRINCGVGRRISRGECTWAKRLSATRKQIPPRPATATAAYARSSFTGIRGFTAATNGKVLVQLVRAARKSAEAKGGTGFHFHTADVHVVYMVRGWARFDYDGIDTLVEAGDCVHQRPGIVHSLYDWSDDMEFMEIIMPGDFATTEITPPALAAAAAGR